MHTQFRGLLLWSWRMHWWCCRKFPWRLYLSHLLYKQSLVEGHWYCNICSSRFVPNSLSHWIFEQLSSQQLGDFYGLVNRFRDDWCNQQRHTRQSLVCDQLVRTEQCGVVDTCGTCYLACGLCVRFQSVQVWWLNSIKIIAWVVALINWLIYFLSW